MEGEIVITFSQTMGTSAGTVSLDGGDSTLTGTEWSNYDQTYTVSYSRLSYETEYTVNIFGFTNTYGTEMVADSTHSFKTIIKCGNGGYYIETDSDSAYTASYTNDGLLNLTVNDEQSGFTYFNVGISAVTSHSGDEVCLFVHIRNGVQISIVAFRDDFDSGGSPCAAFNVQPSDVVEVYIVDALTNDEGTSPTIL